MRAEAPERVLVLAHLAQVQPVRIDVADVAQLAGVDDLLQLRHAGVVLEQVSRPSGRGPPAAASSTTAAASAADCASGFSTKQCLPARRTSVASRACEGTSVATTTASSSGSASRSPEVGGEPRAGERALQPLALLRRDVAAPAQLATVERSEVAGQVRPPVAEADDARRDVASRCSPGARTGSKAHQIGGVDLARDAAEVEHQLGAGDDPAVVDLPVRGHDHDQVRLPRAPRRAAWTGGPPRAATGRAGRGRRGPRPVRRAASGSSAPATGAMSATPGLYETPSSTIREPCTGLPWEFRVRSILSTQK